MLCFKRRRLSWSAVRLVLIVLFSQPFAWADFSPFSFFSNSKRRDATVAEADSVVRVKGCTGFFVKNNQNKTYIASARHCYGFRATQWCHSSEARFIDSLGNHGTCKGLIAGDSSHDIVLFEAEFPKEAPEHPAYVLAAYAPARKTLLTMIGYPGDKYRKGKLTVTENCWILRANIRSPHGHSTDRSSLHNCTTYGGNSGGPILHEATDTVVGLPFTYVPNDYRLRDPENERSAAYLAQMADFVSNHRKALEDAGVEIMD